MTNRNRKTRIALAVASALAGMLAYVLLPTVTTHDVSNDTTVTTTVSSPAGSKSEVMAIGPQGTMPFETTAESFTLPYGPNISATLDGTETYVGVPTEVTLNATLDLPASPWSAVVAVTPSAGVTLAPLTPEIWDQGAWTGQPVGTPQSQTMVVVPSAETAHGARVTIGNRGLASNLNLQTVAYDLTATRPGDYTVSFSANGQSVRATVRVVSLPGHEVLKRVDTTYPEASMGVSSGGLPAGTQVQFTVRGRLSKPSYSIDKTVTLTAPVTGNSGPSRVVLPQMTPQTSGIVTTTAPSTPGVSLEAGLGVQPIFSETVSDPATSSPITTVSHNPLWLVLGGAAGALLVLVPFGRRNRNGDGGDGDGQDA